MQTDPVSWITHDNNRSTNQNASASSNETYPSSQLPRLHNLHPPRPRKQQHQCTSGKEDVAQDEFEVVGPFFGNYPTT